MSRWRKRLDIGRLSSEKAQGMTEYILVASLLMITASVSFNYFGRVVMAYYETIAIVVALPLP